MNKFLAVKGLLLTALRVAVSITEMVWICSHRSPVLVLRGDGCRDRVLCGVRMDGNEGLEGPMNSQHCVTMRPVRVAPVHVAESPEAHTQKRRQQQPLDRQKLIWRDR